MFKELQRYGSDFKDLVDLVYSTHHQHNCYQESGYLKQLHTLLLEVQAKHTNEFCLDIADIRQQLALIWFELVQRYRINRPKVGLRTYLQRLSVWRMRDWYCSQARVLLQNPEPVYEDVKIYHGFKLNFDFLRKGTNYYPLSELSPYERYLLFLKFKQDKNILEIADIVQKDRYTVSQHMKKIFEKMRQLKCEHKTIL